MKFFRLDHRLSSVPSSIQWSRNHKNDRNPHCYCIFMNHDMNIHIRCSVFGVCIRLWTHRWVSLGYKLHITIDLYICLLEIVIPFLCFPDRHDVTSKDDIDSPGSSGVHSMEPDEAVQERLLSLKEHTDSQTKHVPSDLSCKGYRQILSSYW